MDVTVPPVNVSTRRKRSPGFLMTHFSFAFAFGFTHSRFLGGYQSRIKLKSDLSPPTFIDIRFTLLLDEVGRQIEPAYRLKERWLTGEKDSQTLKKDAAEARQSLKAAPIQELLETYAQRVRSRGELGVLSALNQKLWLQYRELDRFLASAEAPQ